MSNWLCLFTVVVWATRMENDDAFSSYRNQNKHYIQ